VILERLRCDKTTEQGHDEVYYLLAGIDGSGKEIKRRGPDATQGGVADKQTAWDMNDSGAEQDQRFNAVLYEADLDVNQTASLAFAFLESDNTNPGQQLAAAGKLVAEIGEDLKQPGVSVAGRVAQLVGGFLPTNQDDYLGGFQLRVHNDPNLSGLVVQDCLVGQYTTMLGRSDPNNGYFSLQFQHDDGNYTAHFRVDPVRTRRLNTSIWPNGKAYFFKSSLYARYDPIADKVDEGYPKTIAGNWPGLPPAFTAGIDAYVVWPNGKAYFFKGSDYVRYDMAADRADSGYPRPISGNWPGLWTSGIDAAVAWSNGKAYFFKGSQYVRYDIVSDKVDDGYPRPIAGNWPGFPADFAAGLDAAVMWNNGKAYFFKGVNYVRYDVAADKVDSGFPRPIAGNWRGLWDSVISA
jgi:hypothetical protein